MMCLFQVISYKSNWDVSLQLTQIIIMEKQVLGFLCLVNASRNAVQKRIANQETTNRKSRLVHQYERLLQHGESYY